VIYLAKSDQSWATGATPPEARRSAGINLRDDHTLWQCSDPQASVNEAGGIVHDHDAVIMLLSEWRDGVRVDHVANPPQRINFGEI
jgi:hypothetical protein